MTGRGVGVVLSAMRVISERQLEQALAALPVCERRVVASGNLASPRALLNTLERAVERYRLFMLARASSAARPRRRDRPPLSDPVTSFQHSAVIAEQGCAHIFGRSECAQARLIIEHAAHPYAREELHQYAATLPQGAAQAAVQHS
jgi:hypothetical protein